jgi:hypothetical protein
MFWMNSYKPETVVNFGTPHNPGLLQTGKSIPLLQPYLRKDKEKGEASAS